MTVQVCEECPECGSELSREPHIEHGTRRQKTKRVYVKCENCEFSKYSDEISEENKVPIEEVAQ
ncbi:hypothetical protein [Haloplanus natans]|uniref:hypothetical protein n=1 Tax=Haloplanus natans TaxID=376171 RepID=UPI0012FAFE32|nr:hypothetical protein [Haloplanus natans]